MKPFHPIALSIIAIMFFPSCILDRCSSRLDDWRNGALADLQETRMVLDELALYGYTPNDNAFFRSHDQTLDASKPIPYLDSMPKLKSWMENHPEGYISLGGGQISMQLLSCGNYTAYHVSINNYRPEERKYKLVAEIIDTMALGDGWHYLVTKCTGCGD